MKFLAVVNTICLLALVGLACFSAHKLDKITQGVWFQNYLLTKDDTILEYMGSSGLTPPTEDWPYWNTAVQGNPPTGDWRKLGSATEKLKCQVENLTKTISFTKPSSCQIQPKDICTEIAYIWNKFETLDASRAEFEALFYTHIFKDSRSGIVPIVPRRQ